VRGLNAGVPPSEKEVVTGGDAVYAGKGGPCGLETPLRRTEAVYGGARRVLRKKLCMEKKSCVKRVVNFYRQRAIWRRDPLSGAVE
jgi:hypothetical protein